MLERLQGGKTDVCLSIIIVTWNGKKYALECLESLKCQQIGVSTEIIIVDNGSTDGTPEAIKSQFKDVTVIENGANVGFSRANNIGIRASSGRYLCLVNSDVVIPTGCFERMIEYMEGHQDVGVLGPKMLSPTGGIGESVMRFPTVWNTLCCALGLHVLFPRSSVLGGFAMEAYPYSAVDSVEVLTGWFWMIPRCALKKCRTSRRTVLYVR